MDILTLATTALTLATPFLTKVGEEISTKVGEDIWNVIKKPFTKEKSEALMTNQEDLKKELVIKLNEDLAFQKELREQVEKSQNEIFNQTQQVINNNGNIEKQVNIGNVSGNINL
ncbi:hypothetical protein MCERE19_01715 [Spirosomataceae bacterium]